MTNARQYDGTKESADAAWFQAKAKRDEAIAAAENASRLLFEAHDLFLAEERRHQYPSASQHEIVRWEQVAVILQNCAGALGGGDPNQIVTLVDGSYFQVEYVEKPIVSM